jgi:phosphotransferase system enzyme I (PtsI)
LVGGDALGRLTVMPTFEGMPSTHHESDQAKAEVERAISTVMRTITKAYRKLEADIPEEPRRELTSLMLILDDERLRDLIRTECIAHGIVRGLRNVAREYAAAPYRAGNSEGAESSWATRRAREVEELCLLIAASATGQSLPTAGSALMVADHLGAFTVLGMCVQRATGIAVGGHVHSDELGLVIARAARIPVVADVAGLFAWARPEDTILIDGDKGVVRVNPSVNVIAKYRHDRATT